MAGHIDNRNVRVANRWRTTIWSTAAFLLLLPLAAMQFNLGVDWGLADFATFGGMLLVACGTYEMAARATGNRAYRGAVGLAIATAFLLVWANLAVGFIGDEGNPANLMFGGVLAVGICGAIVARFRPHGMALAMVAMAAAQVLVAVVGWTARLGDTPLIPTAVFAASWLASAALFRKAAREAPGASS